jgi:hypothetical protein
MIFVSPEAFAEVARDVLGMPNGAKKRSIGEERQLFGAHLGVSFEICSVL